MGVGHSGCTACRVASRRDSSDWVCRGPGHTGSRPIEGCSGRDRPGSYRAGAHRDSVCRVRRRTGSRLAGGRGRTGFYQVGAHRNSSRSGWANRELPGVDPVGSVGSARRCEGRGGSIVLRAVAGLIERGAAMSSKRSGAEPGSADSVCRLAARAAEPDFAVRSIRAGRWGSLVAGRCGWGRSTREFRCARARFRSGHGNRCVPRPSRLWRSGACGALLRKPDRAGPSGRSGWPTDLLATGLPRFANSIRAVEHTPVSEWFRWR